jgi:hypothetical protein
VTGTSPPCSDEETEAKRRKVIYLLRFPDEFLSRAANKELVGRKLGIPEFSSSGPLGDKP